MSWNGLSQTVHLVSPSSSSSLSSSTVPLCCEAVNDECNTDHKCSRRIGDNASKNRNSIRGLCVCERSQLYKLQPPRTMIRDPSWCGRITWSRTARGPQEWRDKWTSADCSWIIKLKRRYWPKSTKRRLRREIRRWFLASLAAKRDARWVFMISIVQR